MARPLGESLLKLLLAGASLMMLVERQRDGEMLLLTPLNLVNKVFVQFDATVLFLNLQSNIFFLNWQGQSLCKMAGGTKRAL